MRSVRLRWLVAAVAVVALVLAACSAPQTPAPTQPENPVVELDGFQAQIEMSKVDLEPLSFWRPPQTQYCETNVAYAQVIVPMIGIDSEGKLSGYVDVFWMPRNWNHKLALYAHGYISPTDPGFLDQILNPSSATQPLLETRDRLLCEGYALGASSFSDQGYAVQQGIIDTHLMNAVFPFIFWRRPSETYVFGSSMGGLITVALAELFPYRYDGAMPTCGPLAGSLAEFSYIGNVRLLFDTAFPTVLNGDLTNWEEPEPTWVQDVLTAISATAPGQAAFAALDNTAVTYPLPVVGALKLPLLQTPKNYALLLGMPYDPSNPAFAPEIAANALVHALRYHVEGAQEAIDRAGGSPFSNEGLSYGPLVDLPFPIPDYVEPTEFYQAARSAILYYSVYYQPRGNLHVPTLALQTPVDPDVPTVHEAIYRALVQMNPRAAPDILRAYLINGYVPDDLLIMGGQDPNSLPPIQARPDFPYGHCNIRPGDLVTGLNFVAERASTGSWPAAPAAFEALPPITVP